MKKRKAERGKDQVMRPESHDQLQNQKKKEKFHI